LLSILGRRALAFGKASRFLGDARRFLRGVTLKRGKTPLRFGGASRMVGAGALTTGAPCSFTGSAALAACDAAFLGRNDGCFVHQASCWSRGASLLACRAPLRIREARLYEGNACLRGDNAPCLEDRASFLEAEAR
jgi:hypothetical protein